MNVSALRNQFLGGVWESPKLSLKRFIFLLLSVLHLSLPGLISAADSPTENPTIDTEVTPPESTSKAPQPKLQKSQSELSTYKLQNWRQFCRHCGRLS